MQFAAIADLAGTVLALDVFLNDVFQGQVFRNTGTRCPATPNEDQLMVAMTDFNTLVGSGDTIIRIETGDSVEFDACSGSSWVSVALDYLAPPVVPDVNGNGVPDSCDLARGDFNLDGFVNVTDLLSLLAAWGVCPGLPRGHQPRWQRQRHRPAHPPGQLGVRKKAWRHGGLSQTRRGGETWRLEGLNACDIA